MNMWYRGEAKRVAGFLAFPLPGATSETPNLARLLSPPTAEAQKWTAEAFSLPSNHLDLSSEDLISMLHTEKKEAEHVEAATFSRKEEEEGGSHASRHE